MSNKSFTVSLIILLTTIISVAAIASRCVPDIVKTNLENLPMEIAGYKATEDYFPDSVYKELNADIHVYRHYRSQDGKQIDLYVGYYGTAKGGRTPHNPYGCIPGAGWGIVQTDQVILRTDYYENGVGVNYILAQKGGTFETVLHRYQSAGTKVLDSGVKQNLQRFIGRVFYNKNDGAFVRISTIATKSDINDANERIKEFAERILGLLPEYWPEEK